jgi:hypothetical protein
VQTELKRLVLGLGRASIPSLILQAHSQAAHSEVALNTTIVPWQLERLAQLDGHVNAGQPATTNFFFQFFESQNTKIQGKKVQNAPAGQSPQETGQ